MIGSTATERSGHGYGGDGYAATMRWLKPFCAIGIDIGGTKIAGGIVAYEVRGRTPQVLGYRSIPTAAVEGGDAVLARVTGLARELVDEAMRLGAVIETGETDGTEPPVSASGHDASDAEDEEPLAGVPIVGVGVASAGRISSQDGSIAYANEIMPGWTGQPVRAAVEERCGVPCAVLNDVQAYALGELRHGAAAGASTCVMVAAGTGLGGSIIVDGRVVMGAHGYAGELGHTLHPAAAGIRCACGSPSHLESVASGSGIEARYFDRTGNALSGAQIAQLAADGEPDARAIIELAGRSLGESIGSWANMVDPDLVLLSGSVCKAGEIWWDALRDGAREQLPEQMRGLPIVEATLGNDAPVIGAAERLLDVLAE